MKYGEVVKFEEGLEMKNIFSKKSLRVKKGDLALVTKRGYKFLSGEARGQILCFTEEEKENIKGIDCGNISELIYEKIGTLVDIEDILEHEGLSVDDVIYLIEDVLMEIF